MLGSQVPSRKLTVSPARAAIAARLSVLNGSALVPGESSAPLTASTYHSETPAVPPDPAVLVPPELVPPFDRLPVLAVPPVCCPPVLAAPPVCCPPVLAAPPVCCPPVLAAPPVRCPPVLAAPPVCCPPVLAAPSVCCPPVLAVPPVRCPPKLGNSLVECVPTPPTALDAATTSESPAHRSVLPHPHTDSNPNNAKSSVGNTEWSLAQRMIEAFYWHSW